MVGSIGQWLGPEHRTLACRSHSCFDADLRPQTVWYCCVSVLMKRCWEGANSMPALYL